MFVLGGIRIINYSAHSIVTPYEAIGIQHSAIFEFLITNYDYIVVLLIMRQMLSTEIELELELLHFT